MVASMMALRLLARQNFSNIGGAWVGELFESGHLYRNSVTNDVVVCLSFLYKVAFFWRVTELPGGYFKLCEQNLPAKEAVGRFEVVCLTQIESKARESDGAWQGIPASVRHLDCTCKYFGWDPHLPPLTKPPLASDQLW